MKNIEEEFNEWLSEADEITFQTILLKWNEMGLTLVEFDPDFHDVQEN